MRRVIPIVLCAGLALASPAAVLAQARAPAERQNLIDLAYVLGRSHALRQACAGAGDQYWRSRMTALVAAETPDPDFDRRLKASFNSGYAAAQAAFPRCGPRTRREAEDAAARGRALATSLTTPVADDDPSR